MTDISPDLKISTPRFPRIFAFIIDCIVLGVTSMIVGKFLYPYLENSPFVFQCIGTFICLFYFTAFNSNIGEGRTIGKMICRIRVKDLTGLSISPAHSLLRSSIFIIPLCSIGYLQQFSSNQFSLTLLISFFQGIVFACIYLAIFNRKSQQSLHDLISKTQILRNTQSNIPYHSIWNIHYYIITALTVVIFAMNLWLYNPNASLLNNSSNKFTSDITDIQVLDQTISIGDVKSNKQILILNLSTPKYLNQQETAESLLQDLGKQQPDLFSSYEINTVNLISSYQFGAAKISRTKSYDLSFTHNTPKIEVRGESSTTTFGF